MSVSVSVRVEAGEGEVEPLPIAAADRPAADRNRAADHILPIKKSHGRTANPGHRRPIN